MKTVNNIFDLFKVIATSHKQINSFVYGDIGELDTYDNIIYPVLIVSPITSEVNEYTINHTYRLAVADLVNKDEVNQVEVWSDTQQILTDIAKIFRYDDVSFYLLNQPILTPFKDKWDDDVSGWQGDYEIEFDYDSSECNVPIDAFLIPGPTSSGAVPSCITLLSLCDVNVDSPTNGQVLVYQDGEWVNQSILETITLNDLSDVTIDTPNNGDGLVFYNGEWINQAVLNYEKRLVSGGAVWSGTGLVYDVSVLEYYFDAPLASTVATQVTLSPGDADDDRFDAIVIDVDGNVLVVEGDPSPNPITPDTSDYVLVQFISVAQASVVPPVTEETIYNENIGAPEWTGSKYGSGAGTIDFNNTTSPQSGTKCTRAALLTNSAHVRYTDVTPIPFSNYQTFQCYIKFTTVIPANKNMIVRLWGVANSTIGLSPNLFNYGLNRNIINTWQLVTFPVSAFGVGTNLITSMFFRLEGANPQSTPIYFIDNVKLFGNVIPVGPGVTTTLSVASEGTVIGSRPTINFIEGSGINLTVTDSSLNQRVDINVALDTSYTNGIYLPLVGGEMTSGAIISFASAIDIQSDGNIDYEKAWVYGKDGEGMYFGYGYQQVLLTNTQFNASVGDSFIFISEVVDDEAIRIRTQVLPNYTELRLNPEANSLFESTLSLPLDYAADYSANYTNRSLVDKQYVDNTISASSVTASNGLTKSGSDIKFGGTLTENTTINGGNRILRFGTTGTGTELNQFGITTGNVNTNYINLTAGAGTFVIDSNSSSLLTGIYHYYNPNGTYTQQSYDDDGGVTLSHTPTTAIWSGPAAFKGLEYNSDYSANFVNTSLVTKLYVDTAINAIDLSAYLPLTGGTLDNGVNPVTIDFLFNPLTTQRINFGDDEVLTIGAVTNDNSIAVNLNLNTSGEFNLNTYINDGNIWGTTIYSDTYAGLLGLQASKDADTTSIALQWNNITVGSSFATFEGIKYSADYSANYTNRSLVDKEYVDNLGFNQSALSALTISASTAINVNSEFIKNFSATTSLTAVTFTYSNFNDGSSFDIDLLKTTASNTVLTFPASSIISVSGAATVSGLTATLSSTTSGRFTITGKNMGGVYKIYITQDVL